MEIRRLGTAQAAAAVAIVEHLKFPLDQVTDGAVGLDYLRAFLADDRHYFLVAYLGEEPVGYLFGYRLARFSGRPPALFLYEIGVSESHRKKGFGKALIQEMVRLAKADGCEKMFAPTSRLNDPAMALYRAAGGQEGEADATMFWWQW